jgi:phosphatidate cytidylyltransferase
VSGDTAASARPERLPARGLRSPGFLANLARRLGTAAVGIPVLLLVFFRAPPWAGVGLVAAALVVGEYEFFGLLRARGLSPMRRAGLVLAAAFFLDLVFPGWLGVPSAPLGMLLLLGFALARGADFESVSAAAATLLGAVYVGALGGTIAALRLLDPVEKGPWRILMLLVVIMVSDTFAFFVGHAFGRRRLAPSVSPGKSVEGALGGILGGVCGAFVVRTLGFPDMPAWHTAALGAVVAAVGIVGDLDESLLKRWAGVKDSGALFPGHGGMLDRLDSLLFGAPVLYYYFQYFR